MSIGSWFARRISSCSKLFKTHYEVLGVRPNATQADIKSAYYKLSMLFHPDRNQGSKKAADKFCEISRAYEVLGNHRLRKMYDKGLYPGGGGGDKGGAGATAAEPRMRQEETQHFSQTSGHVKYDVHEWTKQHYGESFARRNAARLRYNQNIKDKKKAKSDAQKDHVVMVIVIIFVLLILCALIDDNMDDTKPIRRSTPPRSNPPSSK